MKSTIINKLIDLAEWLKGGPIACVYARLEPYKSNNVGCPFCLGGNKALSSCLGYKLWDVIENEYPYPRTKKHLLIVPKRHVIEYDELQGCELDELSDILNVFLAGDYIMLGRQYPMAGSSVEHLHIHLIKG